MDNLSEIRRTTNESTVTANYSKLSDHIRRLTPQGIQCSVFCGGANCKYENPENWKSDSLAVQGIYSHWITDDILAMARPSTVVLIQRNIIQQFESLGIRSIINLQSPKEHASCGHPLEDSGFSYDPAIFMKHNIYYYNFAWKDYGDATLVGLLNMVKVLAFAITEGRVAIHCHAGLGRTGVLIACFLVYSLRVSANDAIRYVRLKRPGSVQTRGQIVCVRHFAQFILPLTITYYLKDSTNKDKYMNEFTLHRFLKRQKIVLHGYDERNFKNIPKVVHCICERILKLCGCWVDEFPAHSNISFTSDFLCTKLNENIPRHESTYSLCGDNSDSFFANGLKSPSNGASSPVSPNPSENGDSFSEVSTLDGEEMGQDTDLLMENKCFQELETQKCFNPCLVEKPTEIQEISTLVEAFLMNNSNLDIELRSKIRSYQVEINISRLGLAKIAFERDLKVLFALLFDWIEGLKEPVIKTAYYEHIVILYKQTEACFQKFSLEDAFLIEYFMRFVCKIRPISEETKNYLLKRMIAGLSKQTVQIGCVALPMDKGFKKIGDGTLGCAMIFFNALLDLIDEFHHSFHPEVYLNEGETDNDENDFH